MDLITKKLIKLIETGNTDSFYNWAEWKALRLDVLKLDNYECQICKAKGKYKKAVIVHHVKHLKENPELALCIWNGDKRQLISVCKACHEDEHPESQRQWKKIKMPLTVERWD